MSVRYLIGIDGGTESLRARVFDTAGRDLGGASSSYATTFPAPGRAEQDPRDWWRAIGEAVRGARRAAGIGRDEVAAICLDTTSATVVVTDAAGEPLRPAILWMDVRAGAEAAALLATHDAALGVNGAGMGPVSPEWMIPKVLWLKRHERALYDRAQTVCEYQDYMMRRLTGRAIGSLSNVAIRWHYRATAGGWPDTLLAALDLADVRDKWPAEIAAPGAPVGPLTAAAAEHLGLARSTLVVQGGVDAFIGMIGLGVAREGQLALVTGSSHLQLAVTSRPVAVRGLWGSYANAVYPGRHVLEGGQTSSGSMIAWLRRFAGDDADLARLNQEAALLPPGSEGLTVLDHFQGNRTPHTDADSRGALVGLALSHTRAHVFRAMIEGICCGTRQILDVMNAAGVAIEEIVIGGGASHSPLWVQIHADTAQRPISVPRVTDAPALGSAILAAVGVGEFADIDAGIEAMVGIDRVVEPDPAHAAAYADAFDRYDRLYAALKAWREARRPAA